LSDKPNADQTSAWNGPEGEHWAANDDLYNAGVRVHSERLYEAARFTARDRVLDIGCGAGETTRAAARAASSAFGLDVSLPMVERARDRARRELVRNVRFEQGDAQVYPFDEDSFDVVISRFGVMFFDDPTAAFRNFARALGPRGRLTMIVWRALAENEWLVKIRAAVAVGREMPEPPPNVPSPFRFAVPEHTARMLIECGFDDVVVQAVDEPIVIGANAEEAFSFFGEGPMGQGLMKDLGEPDREQAIASLRKLFADHDGRGGVRLPTASWLVTAKK